MKPWASAFVITLVTLFGSIALVSCRPSGTQAPEISFAKVPDFGPGNSTQLEVLESSVSGARSGQKIVLYARSGDWWIQPLANQPFTAIQKDSSWKNHTHPGSDYAALLVDGNYHPSLRTSELPGVGGPVLAVTKVRSQAVYPAFGKTILFAGYEWQIRNSENNSGGTRNFYDQNNVWLDRNGLLHFRISGNPNHWTSAEVSMRRSLGYGTYRFVVRDLARMELAAVFNMMTWADEESSREMDIEISKWGETFTKNGQFVIQPYHVPANTVQFQVPDGLVTFMLRWAPGRASFRAFRGVTANWDQEPIRQHVFTSGVPEPADETVHMNLYVFGNQTNPLRRGTEVVVEAFDYLP